MMVRFEFHGGFMDGQTVVGEDDMHVPENPARHYLFLTDGGRIGARFREMPPDQADEERLLILGEEAFRAWKALQECMEKEGSFGQSAESLKLCDEFWKAWEESWGETLGGAKSFTEEEAIDFARQLQEIKWHVYEVTHRHERPEGLLVHVKFVGEDTW
jgi:hypothetical protein